MEYLWRPPSQAVKTGGWELRCNFLDYLWARDRRATYYFVFFSQRLVVRARLRWRDVFTAQFLVHATHAQRKTIAALATRGYYDTARLRHRWLRAAPPRRVAGRRRQPGISWDHVSAVTLSLTASSPWPTQRVHLSLSTCAAFGFFQHRSRRGSHGPACRCSRAARDGLASVSAFCMASHPAFALCIIVHGAL